MKKNVALQDLQKTHSSLTTEHNEYEKYGVYLKQEISDLIDANEKLLSCLKDRYNIFVQLSNDNTQFDESIDKKFEELQKKNVLKGKISKLSRSPNLKKAITPTVEKTKSRLKKVRDKLIESQTDPIGELILLTDEKNRFEAENIQLQQEIDEFDQIFNKKISNKEIPDSFIEILDTLKTKISNVNDCQKEKEQIDPTCQTKTFFSKSIIKQEENNTHFETPTSNKAQNLGEITTPFKTDDFSTEDNRGNSAFATIRPHSAITDDSKSGAENVNNPFLTEEDVIKKEERKKKNISTEETIEISQYKRKAQSKQEPDSKEKTNKEKTNKEKTNKEKTNKEKTNKEKTNKEKTSKEKTSKEKTSKEKTSKEKNNNKSGNKEKNNNKTNDKLLNSESTGNGSGGEYETDVQKEKTKKKNKSFPKNKQETSSDMSGSAVLELLEIKPNSNATLSSFSELCDSDARERLLIQREKAKKAKKAKEKMEKRERARKLKEIKRAKAKENQEKKEKEALRKEKEDKENKKLQETIFNTAPEKVADFSEDSSSTKKKKRKQKENKKNDEPVFEGPLVTHSCAEEFHDDESYYAYEYYYDDELEEEEEEFEEEENDFEEEEDFVFFVQRKAQTQICLRTLKASALTEELQKIKYCQELTNEIASEETKLTEIDADLLELVKKLDLRKMKIETVQRRMNFSKKIVSIQIAPAPPKSYSNAEVEFKSVNDIEDLRQIIDNNSTKTSQKFLYIQTKRDLEQAMVKLSVEAKVVNLENVRRQSEYEELMSRLQIIDPYMYNIEAKIEQSETIAPEQHKRRLKNQKILQRIQKRIDLLKKAYQEMENQIVDTKYIIKNHKTHLYNKGKSPYLNVDDMCNQLRNDKGVIQEIIRQTSFRNVETQFISNRLKKMNGIYGKDALNVFANEVNQLEQQLDQMKTRYNMLRGDKGKRSIILTNRSELSSLQQRISDRANEIDVCKMRMNGIVSKVNKQMKAISHIQINLPDPPESWNNALAFVKKKTQKPKKKTVT